jgi:hypothetical protein
MDRSGSLTDSDFGPQGAIQIRQVIRSADLTVHALEHMDRLQPVPLVDPMTADETLLYQTVRQVGGTYQQVFGPLIGKLEGAYRWFIGPDPAAPLENGPLPNRDHGIVAAGLEYGLPHGNGSQSTFLLEAETIVGVDGQTRLALSPFQRDLLSGWRFARNDEAGKELVVAVIVDLERRGEYLLNASYRQRLGETWTVSVGLRIFEARATPPLEARGLEILRNGDHARVALTRHF